MPKISRFFFHFDFRVFGFHLFHYFLLFSNDDRWRRVANPFELNEKRRRYDNRIRGLAGRRCAAASSLASEQKNAGSNPAEGHLGIYFVFVFDVVVVDDDEQC
jgi:hypothetical protein